MSEKITYLGVQKNKLTDMTKIALKSGNITSFGGIFHVIDEFSKLGFKELINNELGKRGKISSAYQYADIIAATFLNYLCNGDCLEDSNDIITQVNHRPNTQYPFADTIGRGLKELAEEDTMFKCEKSDKEYAFNKAVKLNKLLLLMVKRMKLIESGSKITLDFDHQFIPTHKRDTKYSYKQDYGYFPGWATCNGIFLGGENRDGNTNVKFHQADTLESIMSRVKDILNVEIDKFRADCGSYSKEIIKTVEKHCNHFYIRASNCGARYEEFRNHTEWTKAEIGSEYYDVTSLSVNDIIEDKTYRLVVQRSIKKDTEGNELEDMFGKVYVYRCIITNDWGMTEEDIIKFYNKRGESEKNFDIQNNDFGWAHLPFSFLKENTVFMLVTAMLKNFYLYLMTNISEKVKALKKTSRLKSFLRHFICVPAKWICSGRQNILNLYTDRTYYKEIFSD